MDARTTLEQLHKKLGEAITKRDPEYAAVAEYEADPYADMLGQTLGEIEKAQEEGEAEATERLKALHRTLDNFFALEKAAAASVQSIVDNGAHGLKGVLSPSEHSDPWANPEPTYEEPNWQAKQSQGSVAENGLKTGGNLNGRASGPDKGGEQTPGAGPKAGGSNYEMAKGLDFEEDADLVDPSWDENSDLAGGMHPADREKAKLQKRNADRSGKRDADRTAPADRRGDVLASLPGVSSTMNLG